MVDYYLDLLHIISENCGKILIGIQLIEQLTLPQIWFRARRPYLSDIFPSDSYYFERLYATGSNPQHVSIFFPSTSSNRPSQPRMKEIDGEIILFRHINAMRRILPIAAASQAQDEWQSSHGCSRVFNGIGMLILTNFRLLHFPPASLPASALESAASIKDTLEMSATEDLSFRSRLDVTNYEVGDTAVIQILLPMISKVYTRELTAETSDIVLHLKTGMSVTFHVVRNMMMARESSLDFDKGLCSAASKPSYWVNRVSDEVSVL